MNHNKNDLCGFQVGNVWCVNPKPCLMHNIIESKCTCNFPDETSAEIGHFLTCPMADKDFRWKKEKTKKCCEKCHNVDFDKTYPEHTAHNFCGNLLCVCHKKEESSQEDWEKEADKILFGGKQAERIKNFIRKLLAERDNVEVVERNIIIPVSREESEKEEWGGWKIVSNMLDNPTNGIYPTSKCYKELYDFVVAQKNKAYEEGYHANT